MIFLIPLWSSKIMSRTWPQTSTRQSWLDTWFVHFESILTLNFSGTTADFTVGQSSAAGQGDTHSEPYLAHICTYPHTVTTSSHRKRFWLTQNVQHIIPSLTIDATQEPLAAATSTLPVVHSTKVETPPRQTPNQSHTSQLGSTGNTWAHVIKIHTWWILVYV